MSHNYSKGQMNTNNQVAQQQLQLQQQQLGQYNDYVKQLLANGGYLPGVKQALTSTAIQQIPGAYQNIAQNLGTAAASRGLAGGGNLPGGGGYLRDYGSLLSAQEQAKANALNQITAQGQQNIAQGESGILQGAGINAGVGSSALGNATNAANSATQNSSGLLGTFLGAAGGVLGNVVNQNPGNIFG
jgi:hypothetical protein